MSKNALLRVTQMNAVQFDKDIFNLFADHIRKSLEYLPPGFAASYTSELNLLLRLAIIHYSILKGDCTFGQKLVCIKYSNLTNFKKFFYVVFDCLEYVKIKLEDKTNNKTFKYYLGLIFAAVQLCKLLNVSIFLRTGTKPELLHRVLSLDQMYSKEDVQRIYDTQYMTKELLWNTFIELLVYTLPLINYQKVKRTLKYLNPFHTQSMHASIDSRLYTVNTKCPHCRHFPIIPHHMGCAHVFCYTCLKGNQIADPKYECPICEYKSVNNMCERVSLPP